MGARRYSPATGRWLQQDQYYGAFDNLGLAQDPLNSNRYLFTGANPINYIETDGHLFIAGTGAGGGGFSSNKVLPCWMRPGCRSSPSNRGWWRHGRPAR